MNSNFKTWLIEEYGLADSAANSRIANVQKIERYYGNIDALIRNGGAQTLLNELSYSTEDERNGLPQKHKIPIHGNIRTGSATLKQAVNRYLEFYQVADNEDETSNQIVEVPNEINRLFDQVKKVLDGFRPSKIQSSYSAKQEVKNCIQLPLLEQLRHAIPTVKWEMEAKLSNKVKDSVDILGVVDDNTNVVIEIDTHRTDQIGKKFVSRQALTDDKNTIYVVVTYPNQNCMGQTEKKALQKYERYMNTLVKLLSQGSNLDKLFYLKNLL